MTKQTAEIRAEKLKNILKKLECGKHVQNRTLQAWLTEEEFADIDYEWENQKELREELMDKPDEIIEYEKRLKKALFAYNKYTSYKNRSTTKKAKNISDMHFERLLEYLQEIIYTDPSLSEWFDRELDFSFNGNLSIDPIGIPRVITSRSLDCQSNHFKSSPYPKLTKNQVKQNIVSEAIDYINNPPKESTQANKDKLKELLDKIKNSP